MTEEPSESIRILRNALERNEEHIKSIEASIKAAKDEIAQKKGYIAYIKEAKEKEIAELETAIKERMECMPPIIETNRGIQRDIEILTQFEDNSTNYIIGEAGNGNNSYPSNNEG